MLEEMLVWVGQCFFHKHAPAASLMQSACPPWWQALGITLVMLFEHLWGDSTYYCNCLPSASILITIKECYSEKQHCILPRNLIKLKAVELDIDQQRYYGNNFTSRHERWRCPKKSASLGRKERKSRPLHLALKNIQPKGRCDSTF